MSSSNDHSHHTPAYYVKIWVILLVLMALSLIGPELGIKWVTIVTAFGIAIVKALIVAAYFMHLNVEKKYIHYLLYAMLLFMGLFMAGTIVDINKDHGSNWVNQASRDYVERSVADIEKAADGHHKPKH